MEYCAHTISALTLFSVKPFPNWGPYVVLLHDWDIVRGDIKNYFSEPAPFSYPCPSEEAPDETLLARLNILNQNIYMQNEAACKARARAFGSNVAEARLAYDLVALQEYFDNLDADLFSCDAPPLKNALMSTGRYLERNARLHYPKGEWWQGQINGGIGLFSRHRITEFEEHEWNVDSIVGRAHGFIFARIKLSNSPVSIDTYTVHVHARGDGCDEDCHAKELDKLAAIIKRNSSRSGNPVIVMGDFNMGGPPTYSGNPGYANIMRKLGNPRDLWLEAHPQGGPGHTYDCRNPLTDCHPDGDSQRIDYIFVLDDPAFTNNPYAVKLANLHDVDIVRWNVGTDRPVSDHYGLETRLEIRRKPPPPPQPSARLSVTINSPLPLPDDPRVGVSVTNESGNAVARRLKASTTLNLPFGTYKLHASGWDIGGACKPDWIAYEPKPKSQTAVLGSLDDPNDSATVSYEKVDLGGGECGPPRP